MHDKNKERAPVSQLMYVLFTSAIVSHSLEIAAEMKESNNGGGGNLNLTFKRDVTPIRTYLG